MATNDITGDRIRSRPNNKAFDDEFERIFGVKHAKPNQGDDKQDRAVYSSADRDERGSDSE